MFNIKRCKVIWDIGNAFAAGEDPSESFELLKDRLAYVQVKDGKGRAPDWRLCPLGQGDVPLDQAFELLLANDYQGAFSVEWEYAWHPELDPPENALPAALRTVRELLAASPTGVDMTVGRSYSPEWHDYQDLLTGRQVRRLSDRARWQAGGLHLKSNRLQKRLPHRLELRTMKFGFITTEGGTYFNEALEEAIYGEELGFDSVWLEEHHSIRNHYWPSPLMALAAIATRTKRVLLGTDIVVLPFYHPVRAAEDTAMLDVISNGRADLRCRDRLSASRIRVV